MSSTNHEHTTYFFPLGPTFGQELLEEYYFQFLMKLVTEKLGSVNNYGMQRVRWSARHEVGHYLAAHALTQFSDQIQCTMALIISTVEGQTTFQPACVTELSDDLTLDERFFIIASIILGAYHVDDDPEELSPSDQAKLKEITAQLSEATPLTNTLSEKIAKALDPTSKLWDELFLNLD